ncbi:DUF4276 family protein [Aquabacterium sp. A7-Y]|uniref:DUF4276 family protein n=1 Tax=Aquabacterium sp. A7-Y TaxID=1349605 RepID=UPI00223CE3C5|nr:DUF4276 family protein [Aquabacterium sp. A7-Y]MCW7537396.1 DUF4276 family protein [Aquabacterium sp. A7-Y]
MTTIVTIVEGDGEVKAVPILLRRIAESHGVYDLDVPVPIRVHRDQFIQRQDEFQRKVLLAAAKAGLAGVILILLDADDDCPVELARAIGERASAVAPHKTISVVIANREYEAWFLAAADSLAGKRGLSPELQPPADPDALRNAKGWLSQRMPGGRYHEVLDQAAMTAIFDIDEAARRSRSMRRLCSVVEAAL